MKRGIVIGVKRGMNEKAVSVAKKRIGMNTDKAAIADVAGLPLEQIKAHAGAERQKHRCDARIG